MSKQEKGYNSEKTHFELSPLIVWIGLLILYIYSELQVNVFSNNRETSKFLYDADDANDNTKTIAMSQVFSENRRAKKVADCHKKYMCKVSSHLVQRIKRNITRPINGKQIDMMQKLYPSAYGSGIIICHQINVLEMKIALNLQADNSHLLTMSEKLFKTLCRVLPRTRPCANCA